jgi:hypothetical protein
LNSAKKSNVQRLLIAVQPLDCIRVPAQRHRYEQLF